MDTIQVVYTTSATATGGRNGHTRSQDGQVDVDLSVPKAMGGPGKPGTTTPEDLFAAGYAAWISSPSSTAWTPRVPASPARCRSARATREGSDWR